MIQFNALDSYAQENKGRLNSICNHPVSGRIDHIIRNLTKHGVNTEIDRYPDDYIRDQLRGKVLSNLRLLEENRDIGPIGFK